MHINTSVNSFLFPSGIYTTIILNGIYLHPKNQPFCGNQRFKGGLPQLTKVFPASIINKHLGKGGQVFS